MGLRNSQQMTLVLAEFLVSRETWSYGYNISRKTGLKSGTLYPLLIRLAEHGLLETSWAASEDGRPPRHMYRLTENGVRHAMEQAKAGREAGFPKVALSGAAL